MQFFSRKVEHFLVACERRGIHWFGGSVRIDEFRIEIAHTILQPLFVGCSRFQNVVYVVIFQQHAIDQIDGKHLTWAKPTFAKYVFFVVVIYADFRRDGYVPVFGYHVTRRPQTVAIKAACCVTTIG